MKTRKISAEIFKFVALVFFAVASLTVYSSPMVGDEPGNDWNGNALMHYEKPDSLSKVVDNDSAACHGVGYAHLDPCWRWSINEGINKMRNTSELQLKNMEKYPHYTFSFDVPQLYEWMEDYEPQIFTQISKMVENGRWEPFGGDWGDPLTDLVEGEGFVRQWLIGKRYFKDKLGFEVKVGANLDNYSSWPGGNLPQIAKKCGIEYYSFVRGLTNPVDTDGKFFWWKGNDGTKLFSHDSDGWFNSYSGGDTCSSTVPSLKYYGAGDGGGGPNERQAENGGGTNASSRLIDFFEDAKKRGVPEETDLVAGGYGLSSNGVQGTGLLSHRPYLKWYNRKIICSLTEMEKFSSLAFNLGINFPPHQINAQVGTQMEGDVSYMGASKDGSSGRFNYPQDRINETLKTYLLWQHHDNLPGNFTWEDGVSISHNEYRHIYGTYNNIMKRAFRTIGTQVNTTGDGTSVLVFNSLSWPRTGVKEIPFSEFGNPSDVEVKDADGNIVPSQVVNSDGNKKLVFLAKEVPATGYEEYKVISVDEPAESFSTKLDVDSSNKIIENQYYRVELDKTTGAFKRVYDKVNEREVISNSGKGNYLGHSENHGWPYGREFDEWGEDYEAADNIEVIESGPVRAKVRVTYGPIHQDVIMYPGIKRIDSYTWSDNYKSGGGPAYLRVKYALNISNGKYTTEGPYGYTESPDEQTGLEKPTLRWQDLSNDEYGVSILNDSKYGGDRDSNKVKLSLINYPEFDHQEMRYSLYPHSGDWREGGTVRASRELNNPLEARVVENTHPGELPKNYSFLKAGPENIVVSVVKKHEDSDDLIVRLYETNGKETTANLDFGTSLVKAWEEDMMEWNKISPELTIFDNSTLKIDIEPYEIKTLRVRPETIISGKQAED